MAAAPVLWMGFAAAGIILGGAYFFLMHRTACLHAAGGSAAGILSLYTVRLVLAAAVFGWAVQYGSAALLLALAGFLLARLAAIRLVRPR